MNHPVIPAVYPTMTAPKTSRRFYLALATRSLWAGFVAVFKWWARVKAPSRVLTLDGVDGGERREYMHRWHLIPRNRFFNFYLHKFVAGDDPRALHDHPWASASLILDGRYKELTSEWVSRQDFPYEDFTSHTWKHFNPGDGRRYIDGSVTANATKWPGFFKFDYEQDFRTGDFRRLAPDHTHLIRLFGNNDEPCWTLFMTGPIVRMWGFICQEHGHRDFRTYLEDHPTQPNATRGCE